MSQQQQQQLSREAAAVVAQFLMLSSVDQIAVYAVLSKHQPPPPPPPPPIISFQTTVPFALHTGGGGGGDGAEVQSLSETYVSVCGNFDCKCRYTMSETDKENDTIPKLVPEGIYVRLGKKQKGTNYWYARISKALPFKLIQKQLYITRDCTEAYLILNTHEDAVQAYVSLIRNKFSVNWMRNRRHHQEEEEEGISNE